MSLPELWGVLTRTEDFPRWWSWLSEFDADGLRTGSVAHCVVRAPLPYSLSFVVHVVDAVAWECVHTTVTGDLRGPARLDLASNGDGSRARLRWDLELRHPTLRRVATVARPAMAWAHDRVVDVGVRQFRRRALGLGD
ncbi:MAG: hypothetical protein M5U14_05540 [Acidimicrobiia bacterium]|nr:hypothetical protein [Acidimicrobiia bacterium]